MLGFASSIASSSLVSGLPAACLVKNRHGVAVMGLASCWKERSATGQSFLTVRIQMLPSGGMEKGDLFGVVLVVV